MRPLTRWDVIFVIIVAAGAGTRFLTLAPKPSGWPLVLDVSVSALLGLLAAVVIASLVRRAWLDRLGFTLGVVVVVLGGRRSSCSWISFRPDHGPDTVGRRVMAWKPTPWGAVQAAAWMVVGKNDAR